MHDVGTEMLWNTFVFLTGQRWLLKVGYFRKDFLVFSILPKDERKIRISKLADLQQSLWESSAEFINRKTPLHSPIYPGWQWQCNKLSIVVTPAFVIFPPQKSYNMTCIFCLFGLPIKSHFWVSISCIFLKFLHQICMEKVVKYQKELFWQSKINSDSLFKIKSYKCEC